MSSVLPCAGCGKEKKLEKLRSFRCSLCRKWNKVSLGVRAKNFGKKKRSRTPKDILLEKCDSLWAKIVKARAGFQSQISGRTGNNMALNSHHIFGRESYALRFSLDNGICLTPGEHIYGIHVEGRREKIFAQIEKVKGVKVMGKISNLRHQIGKTDLKLIFIYLKEEEKHIELKKGE